MSFFMFLSFMSFGFGSLSHSLTQEVKLDPVKPIECTQSEEIDYLQWIYSGELFEASQNEDVYRYAISFGLCKKGQIHFLKFEDPGVGIWAENLLSEIDDLRPEVQLEFVSEIKYILTLHVPRILTSGEKSRVRYVLGLSPLRSELNFFWYVDIERKDGVQQVKLSQ